MGELSRQSHLGSAAGWSIGPLPSGRWDWRAWNDGNRHFGTAPTRREAERCAREALAILKDQAARVVRQRLDDG